MTEIEYGIIRNSVTKLIIDSEDIKFAAAKYKAIYRGTALYLFKTEREEKKRVLFAVEVIDRLMNIIHFVLSDDRKTAEQTARHFASYTDSGEYIKMISYDATYWHDNLSKYITDATANVFEPMKKFWSHFSEFLAICKTIFGTESLAASFETGDRILLGDICGTDTALFAKRNVLCVGAKGTGKTRNYGMSNMLLFDGSMMIVDIRDEMYRSAKEKLGDKAKILKARKGDSRSLDEVLWEHGVVLSDMFRGKEKILLFVETTDAVFGDEDREMIKSARRLSEEFLERSRIFGGERKCLLMGEWPDLGEKTVDMLKKYVNVKMLFFIHEINEIKSHIKRNKTFDIGFGTIVFTSDMYSHDQIYAETWRDALSDTAYYCELPRDDLHFLDFKDIYALPWDVRKGVFPFAVRQPHYSPEDRKEEDKK